MIMVVLAQLLVVVYVLGDSVLPSFDWGQLALASLFVQWVVLLSAGALCLLREPLGRLQQVPGVLASFAIILLVSLVSSLVAQQVALANEVFTPSAEQVTEAREILAAMEQAKKDGAGATVYKGRLVDIASIKQAEVIVAQSELIASQ